MVRGWRGILLRYVCDCMTVSRADMCTQDTQEMLIPNKMLFSSGVAEERRMIGSSLFGNQLGKYSALNIEPRPMWIRLLYFCLFLFLVS